MSKYFNNTPISMQKIKANKQVNSTAKQIQFIYKQKSTSA